eukprot:6116586-Prymnesium_polylepis.1
MDMDMDVDVDVDMAHGTWHIAHGTWHMGMALSQSKRPVRAAHARAHKRPMARSHGPRSTPCAMR